MIRLVLFDFGGVLAEEGFRNGLMDIASRHGADPDRFFETGRDLAYSTRYVIGEASEEEFWDAFRKETGITEGNEALRRDILERFVIRPKMLRIARELRERGLAVGILSDQTDWLEKLDRTYKFFQYFDPVLNSYRLHKGKKDPSLFRDVAGMTGLRPEEILFIDDSFGNVERASSEGLKTIHFKDVDQFREELDRFVDSAYKRYS